LPDVRWWGASIARAFVETYSAGRVVAAGRPRWSCGFGGIDSVALLRLLLELRNELGVVVSVVHFNHQLRGTESDADQEFVAELAREHGLEFYGGRGNVTQQAASERAGVEAAARDLRYGFFRSLLGSAEVDEIEQAVSQGLKPESSGMPVGTAQAVPFPIPGPAKCRRQDRHRTHTR